MRTVQHDVLIVGAGPAGLAASSVASSGLRVAIVDENPYPGGQIDRPHWSDALRGRHRAPHPACELFSGVSIYDAPQPGVLLGIGPSGAIRFRHERLILCPGARELFLPFPGWTLPNVMGVGGLQALVKGGLAIEGRGVVVAGSGPLLLAVGASLIQHGARVLAVLEQAPLPSVVGLTPSLLGRRSVQAIQLLRTVGARFRGSSWVTRASGGDRLREVTVSVAGRTRTLECDYLACAFGLVPNVELPRLIGCDLGPNGLVRVDSEQRTSVANVWACGEITGIGGKEKAEAEGRLAAASILGRSDSGAQKALRHEQSFMAALERAYRLRPEVLRLAEPDTTLCRCEDVALRQLGTRHDARDAKLQTRCGMGACQGRVCGPAIRTLFGWPHDSVRPPLCPVPAGVLVEGEPESAQTG